MIRIIGIDPGSCVTGYGIIDQTVSGSITWRAAVSVSRAMRSPPGWG
jgi:Holliday junction resolvasome RuvABC endonuclease subunit